MSEWLMLGFGLILTIGTGFFVASEFSLLNLERSDLEGRAERGEKGLTNTIRALKKHDRILAQTIEEEMFIFENLRELDKKSIGTVLRSVDAAILAVAPDAQVPF